jgi:hypothetical protein
VILSKEHRMWRLLVLGGFLVTLFGISMVLPALAKVKHLGALAGNKGEPLMMLVVGVSVGVAIVMTGLHLLAWGVARRMRKPA